MKGRITSSYEVEFQNKPQTQTSCNATCNEKQHYFGKGKEKKSILETAVIPLSVSKFFFFDLIHTAHISQLVKHGNQLISFL